MLGVPTAWVLKVRVVGESEALGTAPVPVKATVCVLPDTPPALSVTVMVPVRVPVVEGVNVTLIVQFAPPARVELLAGQLLVCEKSLDPAVTAMLLMVRAVVPELVRVTV